MEILNQLTQQDKDILEARSDREKETYLVERFGNDSEKHGIRFGLFPLWAHEAVKQL